MDAIKQLRENIELNKDIVDVKHDKLSKIVKIFSTDIEALAEMNFTKKEQIELLSSLFGRNDINYPNYVKLTGKHITNKPSLTEEKKAESSNSKSEDKKEVSKTPIEDEDDEGYSAMVDVQKKPDLSIKDLPQDLRDQIK